MVMAPLAAPTCTGLSLLPLAALALLLCGVVQADPDAGRRIVRRELHVGHARSGDSVQDDGRFGDEEVVDLAARRVSAEGGATPEELAAFYGEDLGEASGAGFYAPDSKLEKMLEETETPTAGVLKKADPDSFWTLELLHNRKTNSDEDEDAAMLQEDSADEEDEGDLASATGEEEPEEAVDEKPLAESYTSALVGEDVQASMMEFQAASALQSSAALCVKKSTSKWTSNDVRQMANHAMLCDHGQALTEFSLRKSGASLWWDFSCCTYASDFKTCDTFLTDLRADAGGNPMSLDRHTMSCKPSHALTGWELLNSNHKTQLKYTCCELPSDATFQVCSRKTTGQRATTGDVGDLQSHKAVCGSKENMVNWGMVVSGSKYYTEYTCCSVGVVPAHGAARTCAFVGDKHIINFDGQLQQQGGTDIVWLVKSEFVQIQALVNGSIRELAVGGRFMRGHKLMIYDNGSATWDYGIVDKPMEIRGVATIATFKVGGRVVVEASLPLSIYIQTNSTVGEHLNGVISMEEFPGGQNGRCGNNNGFSDDDPVLPFSVPRQERMLHLADLGQDRLHHVQSCNQCGHNFCSTYAMNAPVLPSEFVVDTPLSIWGCNGRDWSKYKVYRNSVTGAVYVLEELNVYDVDNPAEQQRFYSSVWGNNAIGTGHAQSKLDSSVAWCARWNSVGQWMAIKLMEEKKVQGVWLQSRKASPWGNQIVTKVHFDHSKDCKTWTSVDGGKQYNTGLVYGDKSVLIKFNNPVNAKCIKITVNGWQHHISMRAGLSTKPLVNYVTKNVPEASRSYSSVWGSNKIGTGHARSMLDSPQAWSAQHNQRGQWMDIKLDHESSIRGVVFQGRRNVWQWVTKAWFESSKDCSAYDKVDNGKVYSTNMPSFPKEKKELVLFAKPVSAKCIRIKVHSWRGHISMRAAPSVAVSSKAELKQWKDKSEQLRSLSECDTSIREKANKTCSALFSGGDFLQDFLEICVYDKCFDTNKDAAQEDAVLGQELDDEEELVNHRIISFHGDSVSATASRTACLYTLKLPAIRSLHEQQAVEEAANQLDDVDPTATLKDLMWIGGKYVGDRWKWDDGSDICGFTNWADTKQSKLGKSHPYLCMSRSTGKWWACKSSEKLPYVCEEPKVYYTGSEDRALSSTSCEAGEQVAMPKSAAEQLKVVEALKGHTGLVWLGGWYIRDRWEWFDGTKVCYSNWAAGEPKQKTTDTMICADAATGKWHTCSNFNVQRAAVCESATFSKECPAGMLTSADLGLTKLPLQSHSHYMNYCLYMSKGGEDCHQTCARQVNGVCSPSGMHVLSESSTACRFAVQNFGGIGGDGVMTKSLSNDDRACTYVDTGVGGTQEVIYSNGTTEAACDSKTGTAQWHRICACDPAQDEFPEQHIMTEGETAHITGESYGSKPISIEFVKAYSEDCTAPIIVDGKSQWGRALPNRNNYAWTSRNTNAGTFNYVIDLQKHQLVKGLSTRGVSGGNYLKTFTVTFGTRWGYWTDLNTTFTYDNTGTNVLNSIDFPFPVTARYILIWPQTWQGFTVLKISADVCGLKRNENLRLSLLQEPVDTEDEAEEPEAAAALDQDEEQEEPDEAEGENQEQSDMETDAQGNEASLTERRLSSSRSGDDLEGHRRRRRRRRRADAWNLMSLEVVPPKGTESGKMGWKTHTKTSLIAMWPFGLSNLSWSLDVKADSDSWGQALWTVRANGMLLPELTMPRSERQADLVSQISAQATEVRGLHDSLVEPDVSHAATKVSADSRNGCHHHEYSGISDNAVSWEFKLRYTKSGLPQQCIRCETDMGGFSLENPPENKRTYSSVWNNDAVGTYHARSALDSPQAWSAKQNKANEWMAMELSEVKLVEGIYIQNRNSKEPWGKQMVTWATFEHSTDCKTYYGVDDNKRYATGLGKEAPSEKHHLVKFATPVKAMCIRIKVVGWRYHISLRAGLSTKAITDASYGHNIWLNEEGKIVVDLEGATPRRVTFRRRFDPSVSYPIGISYIAKEKVLYLYENRSLQDSVIYTKVPNVMPIKPGYLGCFHGEDVLQGSISSFKITLSPPYYRPNQELCSTMRCPVGFVANLANWNQACSSKPCSPDTDRAKCCLPAKSCTEYKCPSSTVLKSNAAKVFCTDLSCEKTPHTVCCQSKQLCSDMVCKDGFEHIPYPSQVSCQQFKCADADHDVCCRRSARCGQFACPTHYSPKAGAWNTTCKKTPCSLKDDRDTCCAKDSTCSKYKCPAGMVQKANAASIHCQDPGCVNTDFKVCCVDAASCAGLSCPVGKILREEAKALRCAGLACHASDNVTCCEEPESCEHMVCPAGTTLHGQANKYRCKGRLCDPKVDKSTCCVLPGRCNSMRCPATYTHKAKAASILCTDRHCKNTDFKLCCTEEGKCTSMKCAHGYVHRPEAKDVFCHGQTCSATDNSRCCVKPSTCDKFACPAPMVAKPGANTIHCKDYTCTKADTQTCCATPGHCNSLHCPKDYSHRHNASTTLCSDRACSATPYSLCCAKDGSCATYQCPKGFQHQSNYKELLCHKEKCGMSAKDKDICCSPVAKCNSHVCPKGKVLKGNAPQLLCSTSPCSDKDTDTCCDLEGRCSTMKCPVAFKHRLDAPTILCDDKVCKDTPFSKCCAEEGKCVTYKCPVGYSQNPGAKHVHCIGHTCTDADRDKCCLSTPTCGAYKCPKGWTQRDNATTIQCAGTPCDDNDKLTCCVQEGRCASMKCPDNYIHIANAHDVFCKDKACVNTPTSTCCVEEGKCSSFQCPPTKVLRPDAKVLNCKGFKCLNGVDDNTCCELRSTCDSDACTKTQMLRSDHAKHLCKGPKCSVKDDNTECCSNKGMCTMFKCPDGFMHRHNASVTRCSDASCNATDYKVCCAEEGTCNTYTCPAHWVHRPKSHDTHCKGLRCDKRDTSRCCSRVATCGTFVCPAGLTLKPNPLKINCKEGACSTKDTDTCCVKEGRCDSMTCPAGWQNRHDAAKIWCDGTSCNTTDFHKCCQEDGHCLTMTCPTGYLHKKKLDGIKCASWSCQASDRDICCEQNAQCAEVICPKPLVLKAAKNTLQCADKTCNFTDTCGTGPSKGSAAMCQAGGCFWDSGPHHPSYDPKCVTNDVHQCCAQPGTCSMMACPDDYLHVHNAHITPCPDLTCNATNYKTCCVEQNHCRSYKCPVGYDHVSGYEQLFCKGTKCDDTDRDTCCTATATCDTHVCPKYFVAKDNANRLQCKNRECKSPDDDDKCCVHEASCSFFKCPFGMTVKANAKDILCDDKNCTSTHFTKCCDERAKCKSMKCRPGFVLRPSEREVACQGLTCGAADHDMCCDPQANCGSFTCPAPYVAKHKAQKILCRFGQCTDADIHACCATPDSCGHFACPAGYSLKSNARKIPCPMHNCSQTDYLKCCAEQGSCGTFHCPTGLVPVDAAATTSCSSPGNKCTHDDEGTCCQAAAACSTMTCPTGYSLRPLAPFLFCAGAKCNADVDSETCCAEVGSCSSFKCPDGTSHRFDAPKLKCPNMNCSQTGDEIATTCCAKAGTCDTFKCHKSFMRKHDIGTTECRAGNGGACSDADLGVCCDRRAKCSTYTCPSNYVWAQAYQVTFCNSTKCTDDDRDTCCDEQASCAKYTCPAGAVSKFNATCAGKECTKEDEDDCCTESCNAFTCPAGFVNKTDKETLSCSKLQCTDDDVASCCDARAQCSTMEEGFCPNGTVNRGGSALCAGAECDDSDKAACCGGDCATFTCPASSHVAKADSFGICAGMNCSDTDVAACCSERAPCSSVTCPAETTNRGGSAMCLGSTCQLSDIEVCCGQPCYEMTCPSGYSHKTGYLNLLCTKPHCNTAEDVMACCDPNLACEAFHCPNGTANRGATATCGSQRCTADDEASCCVDTCSNANFTCPELHVKKRNAATISCRSRYCGEKGDDETCCEMRASCTTMECGAGLMPQMDRYCAGSECTPADHPECCQVAQAMEALPTMAPAPCKTEASVAVTAAPTEDNDPNYKPDSSCFMGWKPHIECKETFTYKGTEYKGCTDRDNVKPWCYVDDTGFIKTWRECKVCKTVCKDGWMPDAQCKPSFVYKDQTFTGCTSLDYHTPWCYKDDQGAIKIWATCTPCQEGEVRMAISATAEGGAPLKTAVEATPAPTEGEKKESNTKTMFIVFCIVLLGGALVALVAVAAISYARSRQAGGEEAAAPLEEDM